MFKKLFFRKKKKSVTVNAMSLEDLNNHLLAANAKRIGEWEQLRKIAAT